MKIDFSPAIMLRRCRLITLCNVHYYTAVETFLRLSLYMNINAAVLRRPSVTGESAVRHASDAAAVAETRRRRRR